MQNAILMKTMAVFDEYEKRFAKARLEKPLRKPWLPEDRERSWRW